MASASKYPSLSFIRNMSLISNMHLKFNIPSVFHVYLSENAHQNICVFGDLFLFLALVHFFVVLHVCFHF